LATLNITSLPWPLKSSMDFAEHPAHYLETVAPPVLDRAFYTLEGSPAKPHHVAANVDREDDSAPGKFISTMLLGACNLGRY